MNPLKAITLSTLTAFALLSSALTADEREDDIVEVYLATLGRVADKAGLQYWQESNLTIEQITQSFFEQEETQALYASTPTTDAFVQEIYRNVLGREGEEEGVAYWSDALESGKIPKPLFIKAILDGAKGDDATMLQEKTALSKKVIKSNLTDTDAKMVLWTYGKKGYDAALKDLNERADRAAFADQLEIDEPKLEDALESSSLTEGEKNSVRSYFRQKGLSIAKDMIKLIELKDYQGLSSSEQKQVLDVFRDNGGDVSKAKEEIAAIKKANTPSTPTYSGGGSTYTPVDNSGNGGNENSGNSGNENSGDGNGGGDTAGSGGLGF